MKAIRHGFSRVSLSLVMALGGLILAPFSPLSMMAPAVSAQEVASAKVIKQITVDYDGPKTVDANRILANMVTKTGDALNIDRLDDDTKALVGAGMVENVQFLTEDVPGGVRLIVRVTTRGQVGAVEFQGNTKFDDERLRREVTFKVGDSVDDTQLQAAREAILDLYQRRGFPDVAISYRTEADAENQFTRVIFLVTEGAKSYLRDISFTGNTVFETKELRKQMATKERGIFSTFTKSGKIDNAVLEQDIVRVENYYKDAGYLNARVTDVQRTRVDEKTVDLVVTVVEGQKFDVTGVAVSGNTIFSSEELGSAMTLTAGEAYSASKVRADQQTIRDYYGSRGYADVRISPRIDSAGGQLLKVTYQITEGGKSYINRVNIGGNTKTQDKVIRRELAISPGDEYNTVLVDASRARLQNLNYFQSPGGVDFLPTDTGTPGYKDLNITVREKQTGSVNVGVGFSSIDNLVGFFDLTQTNFDALGWPNFTGAGQKFRLGLKYGTRRRDFQMSLVEPWFMDKRLAVGGDLFYRDLFYLSDDYDQRVYGGALHMRRPLGENAYIRAEYKLQNVKIHEIDSNASDAIRAEEGDFLQSQINVDIVHDTRLLDEKFIARGGHKIDLGLSTSGQFLGGDVDTYGVSFGAVQFFHLPYDTILSFEGNFSVVDAWSGDVPIFEREFLGGANNLRGFDFRDVGPKDENGEPLGGGTAAHFTVEYTFPLIENVRGAVFYDAGFVNAGSWDFDTANYNSDVGVGLRLFLPIGPVRLDFGIPLESDEFNDSGGKFNFNIGYQF